MKRWIGIFLVILGFGAQYGSSYILEQVGMGEQQIASAQKKVKMADSALSLSPYTEPLGQGLSSSADKKIQAGKEEIARYVKIAETLKTTSYVLFGLGTVLFLLSFIKNKK